MSSTVAAIATPPGHGAVALIRVSGPGARDVAQGAFRPGRPSGGDWVPRVARHGHVLSQAGDIIDEVLLTWFKAPSSFTGEDVVEIGVHGGLLVTRRVLERLFEVGAEPALPGEFSRRAFENGKLDLTQAEAVMDVISAQTDLSLKAAQEQLAGRLGSRVEALRQALIEVLAQVEAYIDFPEEGIDPATRSELAARLTEIETSVASLLATADQGRILREGLRTVIYGAPNVGKSSLLNHLLGYERAIVSKEAGTTRDTIEEVINLAGVPLRLVDTAGLRASDNAIEREGMARTRRQVELAELAIEVVDGSQAAPPVDENGAPDPVEDGTAPAVRVLNKADLGLHADWAGTEGVVFSCRTGEGAEVLKDEILERVGLAKLESASELIAVNARHTHCLQQTAEALRRAATELENEASPEFVALELRGALGAVGDIVGRVDAEEILGEIFASFCIGK